MHLRFAQKVLFKHCDTAGIVFFPRYAEMVNDGIEALFSDLLLWPFEVIHPEAAVPTVALAFEFKAPSFHGDHLHLDITIKRMGGTSLTVETLASCGDETRFVADQTLVFIDKGGRPQRWPEDVRARVDSLLEATA